MSRIGKNPVPIPKGVKASLSAGALVVEGPLGKLQQPLHPAVKVAVDDAAGQIVVTRA
jgi:large subunit ribosomal protein L6